MQGAPGNAVSLKQGKYPTFCDIEYYPSGVENKTICETMMFLDEHNRRTGEVRTLISSTVQKITAFDGRNSKDKHGQHEKEVHSSS